MRYMSRSDSFILLLLPLMLMPLISIPFAANGRSQSQTLKGHWKGHIDIQSQQLIIKTHFTDGDSLRGTIDIPQQGGQDIQLQNINVINQDSVLFEFQAGPGLAQFRGAFQGDSAIAGSFHQRGMQFPFELKRYEPKTAQQPSNDKVPIKTSEILRDSELAGDWKGAIQTNEPLLIKTHFKKQNDKLKGTIEIQGVELPLQNIEETDDDSVHFEFGPANGLATFKGLFTSDSSITGEFMQKKFTFPFQLHRFEANTVAKQRSKIPLPYQHKELIIKNDSIDIGGTLTWPENKETPQLVIMISGSGAQDRDESLPITDFKPFAALADSLTMAGIATFRYDDRGIGKSTGNFEDTTPDMLASDVEAIIHYFEYEADQHFDQIILLGHSQGGVVGGKVAAENKAVDKLILIASPGVTLKRVLREQVMQPAQKISIDREIIRQEVDARENLMRAIKNQQGLAQAKEDYHQRFKTLQLSLGADSTQAKKAATQQTKTLVAAYGTPQMLSLLFYDPTDDLKKLDIPVLALFGGKDTQVSVAMNKEPIESALDEAGVPHQVKTITDANHLFQKAKTGQVDEYGTLPSQFVEGFLGTIEQWIKKDY